MYCINCGKIVQETSKFCGSCGKNVSENSPTEKNKQNSTPAKSFSAISYKLKIYAVILGILLLIGLLITNFKQNSVPYFIMDVYAMSCGKYLNLDDNDRLKAAEKIHKEDEIYSVKSRFLSAYELRVNLNYRCGNAAEHITLGQLLY